MSGSHSQPSWPWYCLVVSARENWYTAEGYFKQLSNGLERKLVVNVLNKFDVTLMESRAVFEGLETDCSARSPCIYTLSFDI